MDKKDNEDKDGQPKNNLKPEKYYGILYTVYNSDGIKLGEIIMEDAETINDLPEPRDLSAF